MTTLLSNSIQQANLIQSTHNYTLFYIRSNFASIKQVSKTVTFLQIEIYFLSHDSANSSLKIRPQKSTFSSTFLISDLVALRCNDVIRRFSPMSSTRKTRTLVTAYCSRAFITRRGFFARFRKRSRLSAYNNNVIRLSVASPRNRCETRCCRRYQSRNR